MTNTFQQLNHQTGAVHTVVVHDEGDWHSFIPPTRGMTFHNSLATFQEFFGCSDEDLEMIKLKYGEPKPRIFRRVRVT